MKILCPVCNIEGHLQIRGNSVRVQHYLEYTDGKRKYQYHRIGREYLESLEVNGSKRVEVNKADLSSNNYISSMLTKTSSGTRILIIRLITRSSESMSMRRLWIRISHLSQVAVPSPHGVLRTGTRSRLVGREIGPVILTPVLSAMVFSSLHTSSSLW